VLMLPKKLLIHSLTRELFTHCSETSGTTMQRLARFYSMLFDRWLHADILMAKLVRLITLRAS